MTKKILFCALLLGAAFLLLAQYNERDILSQQAFQMLAQRQFGEAEKLYLQILEKFPNDTSSVLQLLNIYYQTSQLDKAESALNQYRRVLSPAQATEQQIQLLVLQGKPDQAWELSQGYLQQQNYQENSYRLLASFFERRGFYDQVLQLYRDARVKLGKPELFQLEIANAALNYRLFDQALKEYLAWLDKNPANLYFINNQCRAILKEDPTRLAAIGDFAAKSENPVIKELYANLLVAQNQYSQALEIYKVLPQDKLVRFADEQYRAANDEVALPSYAYLAETSPDPVSKNNYRYLQAAIQFRDGDHRAADLLLKQIIADSLMLERNNLQRKGVNLAARKLMAENTLALSKDVDSAQYWYAQARQFCTNSYDQQDIDLALVRLLQIRQDYGQAETLLASVSDPDLAERRDYLKFSNELMRGNTEKADSLMNDLVIRYPGGDYINDAIYQLMFALGLSGGDRDSFFSAYRLMLLQDSAAVDSLRSLFERNQDEELLILATEWAILLADKAKARELLQQQWQDNVCSEYAALLSLLLTDDTSAEQRMARDFLKANPNSIFAPKFRQNLSQVNSTRPQF